MGIVGKQTLRVSKPFKLALGETGLIIHGDASTTERQKMVRSSGKDAEIFTTIFGSAVMNMMGRKSPVMMSMSFCGGRTLFCTLTQGELAKKNHTAD